MWQIHGIYHYFIKNTVFFKSCLVSLCYPATRKKNCVPGLGNGKSSSRPGVSVLIELDTAEEKEIILNKTRIKSFIKAKLKISDKTYHHV